ncbi:hypothetical protein ACFQ60_23015 [Streptomyces zhihengii]
MIWVGAVSFVGLVSILSNENSRTLPVGSCATWTPKSGDGKYCRKTPKSDATNRALCLACDVVRDSSRAVRMGCG